MNAFEYVKSVSTTKKDLMTDTDNDELAEQSYVPFVTNKSLSYFPDTILPSNNMNLHSQLDNKLQYHYLLNTVRPAKRFAKWVKNEDVGDLSAVKQFYGYSTEKALQALKILSAENIHYIKQKLERGGDYVNSRFNSRD